MMFVDFQQEGRIVVRCLLGAGSVPESTLHVGAKSRARHNCSARTSMQPGWGPPKWAKRGCAHCAHLGLRIGSYWCRTRPDCGGFRGSGGFSTAGTRFEPHLGHVISLFRGPRASECAQTVHFGPLRGLFLLVCRCCGRRLLLVVSGSGGAVYSFMARGAASCMTGRWLGERCCLCWFAFLDVMTVHGSAAR